MRTKSIDMDSIWKYKTFGYSIKHDFLVQEYKQIYVGLDLKFIWNLFIKLHVISKLTGSKISLINPFSVSGNFTGEKKNSNQNVCINIDKNQACI